MNHIHDPTVYLEAEVEKAIKRAIRNQRRQSKPIKKSRTLIRQVSKRGPKPEVIMNDPLVLNA